MSDNRSRTSARRRILLPTPRSRTGVVVVPASNAFAPRDALLRNHRFLGVKIFFQEEKGSPGEVGGGRMGGQSRSEKGAASPSVREGGAAQIKFFFQFPNRAARVCSAKSHSFATRDSHRKILTEDLRPNGAPWRVLRATKK